MTKNPGKHMFNMLLQNSGPRYDHDALDFMKKLYPVIPENKLIPYKVIANLEANVFKLTVMDHWLLVIFLFNKEKAKTLIDSRVILYSNSADQVLINDTYRGLLPRQLLGTDYKNVKNSQFESIRSNMNKIIDNIASLAVSDPVDLLHDLYLLPRPKWQSVGFFITRAKIMQIYC